VAPAPKRPHGRAPAKTKAAAPPAKPATKAKGGSGVDAAAAAAAAGSGDARPRVALSGFPSAHLTKYGAMIGRLGGAVCGGHAWDPAATHVVFGPRGSRSCKFLAAAASGVPLLARLLVNTAWHVLHRTLNNVTHHTLNNAHRFVYAR
jgi:topoisomerase (DNA) II binding protein 1